MWERWQLTLLPDTKRVLTDTVDGLGVAIRTLYLPGTAGRCSTLTAGTSTADVRPSNGVRRLHGDTTDGVDVWLARRLDGGSTRHLPWDDHGDAADEPGRDDVGYVKGRLMARPRRQHLQRHGVDAASPTPLYTHPNT